jgi:hypothetical protein
MEGLLQGDPLGRRFTEEETRRIFERASTTGAEHPARSRAEGLTLEEIRSIAEEVGLERAAVDRAAAEVVSTPVPPTGRQKLSSLLHEDATIPRALTNDEMRGLIRQVEQILGQRGLLSEAGPWVEWRDATDRLYLGLVRGEGVTRVRAIANIRGELITGAIPIGLTGIVGLSWVGGAGVAAAAVMGGLAAATGLLVRWRVYAGRRYLRELLLLVCDAAR